MALKHVTNHVRRVSFEGGCSCSSSRIGSVSSSVISSVSSSSSSISYRGYVKALVKLTGTEGTEQIGNITLEETGSSVQSLDGFTTKSKRKVQLLLFQPPQSLTHTAQLHLPEQL